jgi:CYTH domain-containing protein
MSQNLMRRALALRYAAEEVSNGLANKEIEHVFYARLNKLEELKKSSGVEHQDQWSIRVEHSDKNSAKGSVRIRKTTVPGSEPEYVLTCKTDTLDGNGIEVPVPTTEAMFLQFQYLCESGMVKHRYHFPVVDSELIWEVDMFLKPDGSYYEWCKIDLEVTDLQAAVPAFPIDFDEIIARPYGERTVDEEARVSSLYDNEFTTRNRFLTKDAPVSKEHVAKPEDGKGADQPAPTPTAA